MEVCIIMIDTALFVSTVKFFKQIEMFCNKNHDIMTVATEIIDNLNRKRGLRSSDVNF